MTAAIRKNQQHKRLDKSQPASKRQHGPSEATTTDAGASSTEPTLRLMRLEAVFSPAVMSEVDIENLSQALGLDKDEWPPTPEPLLFAAGGLSTTSTSTDVSPPAMSTDSEPTDNPPSSTESRQPTDAVTSDGFAVEWASCRDQDHRVGDRAGLVGPSTTAFGRSAVRFPRRLR